MRETFFGSRLELARMRRGLSLAALEVATGIDRGRLYRYQADRQSPPREHVEAIAKATNFLPGFFYLGDAPQIDIRSTSLR